jgi:predicted ATPase/DNA-binding winged helix-turn-helix (wHTH) protein
MKQFESFRLDISNQCLWRDGAQIALPPKPFGILRYLVENPGRLITHDELLDELWPETYVQPQVLRTYMLELRKVLGDDVVSPRFIQTIPKRGYTFVARVTESAEAKNGAAHLAAAGVAHTEPDSVFIDRDEEMLRLQSALESAAAGQRQVVCVAGGAGIGKTALVDAFLRRNHSAGLTVARGQCVEALGRKEEYYPLMEALAHLCASPDGDRACRILARVAPGWLPARSEGQTAPAEPVATRSVRMPGELCSALEELAAEKPLVLVFEDLHWADDSSLGVISALARRRTPGRLMVLATYRAHDGLADPGLKSLKQDLLIRRLCIELNLGPLARQAVAQLLSRELGQEPVPGLAEFIYGRSEGNPLFVKAMLEHLIAERYLVREEAGGWRQRAPFPELDAGVPDQLSQMIELEIGRLGADDQRLLEAASLMSVAFPAWAVAAALGEDAAEIDEACDDLARRLYFVRRAGEDELPDGTRSSFYVFAHGLYREVLYQRQAASRRARRHTRIAERLAQLFAGREVNVSQEMAMHYEAAGNWQRAAGVLVSAAQNARERQAHPEAEALLERALRLAENLAEPQRHAVEGEIRAELASLRESLPATTTDR